jgi:hypothetical protein
VMCRSGALNETPVIASTVPKRLLRCRTSIIDAVSPGKR